MCVCLLVFLYGVLCFCVELVFFVDELGVSFFKVRRLRGGGFIIRDSRCCELAVEMFGCWCSSLCVYQFSLVFLLGSCVARKAVACYSLLCLLFCVCVHFFSFSLSPSLSVFFLLVKRELSMYRVDPLHSLTKEVQRSLTCM